MSQTDNATVAAHLSHVRIVMVNTTLPANIGSALRAMKTMGLNKLVLVAPKTYPHPDIDALAAGATDLIEQIEVVEQLEDAIADCHLVFGTSARTRTIPWPLLDARPAAKKSLNAVTLHGQNIAIIFGREDRGLTNEELALANYHVTIPVNEEYGVLNVAQAIQVICYEMRMAAIDIVGKVADPEATMQVTDSEAMQWDEPLVNHAQMQQFYPHLEKMLAEIEFMDPKNPRLLPLRLRRLFGRIQLDRMEYHLLRGIFSRVQAMNNGSWKKSTSTLDEDQTNA
ncbi:tRNA (cytidine/uridine-2'-O-)-methyltransferase TrmJ [Acinetobacter sp. KAM398]|uniref:tRNA (cytidine/uridine-2'-O-)-methyltransferase TrmJ n=1 Tax=Acinetobacter towneri TaxID=202956 RepID=A0A1E8E4P5_9GAMM|nr:MULTISPECIES: RNA methyltransferase [Acinetobacter]MDM1753517.1 RNA methyltransferase [Acinetobacter towneri]OFE44600.1 tRNA (cytosine(32)/uridine(32)-2'-O)-methyltransferase TrmJ [Acinetobacter towneri]GJC31102.1 tRNA (cytidine/uridine-2'-O-)-methyltransferase TrmJ [Acinetobacter sp. KAM392]GJC33893.1 tRNA (cytidine/uridine-2'-O-)-methyltransferase TrmJ [Acinetobacter sp. KAM393]GJC36722.1 tRNA (cytidine/uridine-2'-O-)-methyltransferase TrmJ [Acinetobacter sp. KAM394]